MNRTALCLVFLCVFAFPALAQQNEQTKFIADTLVLQANGTFEAEPDLATLTFDISSQDKDLTQAYTKATQSMQQIVAVAEKNGLTKQEISTGVLTLTPYAEGNKKPKSYFVQEEIVLKVHDFTKIGAILNDSAENGLANFRALTYALENPEDAKARAVADAMHNAVERAKAALAQNGQKAGAIRYANVDIGQMVGITELSAAQLGSFNETVEIAPGVSGGLFSRKAAVAPPPPPVQPGKITVSATVQCAFQIQ